MNTIETLRAVRERLFEKGWQRFGIGRADGPNCIMGAIYNVTGTSAMEYEKVRPVEEAIRNVVGRSAVDFNDKPGTTFNDMIDAIDLAIKNCEIEEGVKSDH